MGQKQEKLIETGLGRGTVGPTRGKDKRDKPGSRQKAARSARKQPENVEKRVPRNWIPPVKGTEKGNK